MSATIDIGQATAVTATRVRMRSMTIEVEGTEKRSRCRRRNVDGTARDAARCRITGERAR